MSLPDVPNTLREKYYSVMAGQNDADILPDIETAPSTENRYLDYIARNGGGGDVSGVKGDAEETYRTGNVNITAANVGAYTVEQTNTLLDVKADTVEAATENNLAAFDDSGNLKDSGKSSNDFAPANIVPSTATTSNKLVTAADVAGEDISATSTTSPLTDSADGYVQGVTVKGHSEVVDGAIKSIGDAGWGVVDLGTLAFYYNSTYNVFAASLLTAPLIAGYTGVSVLCPKYNSVYGKTISGWGDFTNLDISVGCSWSSQTYGNVVIKNTAYTDATAFKSAMSGVLLYYPLADTTGATPTLGITSKDGAGQGTAATITTGLPLRSVSDSIYDTLDNDKVVKKCAEGDLSTYTWTYLSQYGAWQTNSLQNIISAPPSNDDVADPVITENGYTMSKWSGAWADKIISVNSSGFLVIVDSNLDENTPPTGNIVYALATPTETPLTSAEKTALAQLRTYDSTTYIDATDAPTMTVDYLLNTNNGQAVADIQRDLQEQIDDLGGSPVETVLYDNTNLATVGAVNVTQNLLQPYTDFDEIRVEYAYFYTGTVGNNIIYPFIKTYTVEELETMRTSQYNGRKGYIVFIVLQGMYLALDIVNASQFKISELNSQSQYQHYIIKITGIKY